MKEDQPEEPAAGAEEQLLTLDEAVKFLDTSKSTLYRLLTLQDLKGVKVGKQWRFRKSDLIAYVERGPVAVAVDAGARVDLDSELAFFDQEYLAAGGGATTGENESAGKTPVSKIGDLADRILFLAFLRKASDIHLEPNASSLRLRYRIDGVLHDVRRMPTNLHESLITRFKEMGQMNLIEKRLPQDGRALVRHDGKEYDLRMSLLPTLFGENMVMRILDRSEALQGLVRVGLGSDDLATLRAALHRYRGLVLATGPTGSGKTTLAYSCLLEVANDDNKVHTVEDPVEYQLQDVTQVQVNIRAGLTLAAAMRSILRQDPDVIMCSEIRDLETAELVVRAALTGHLVLSALHTDDAPSALLRLVNIGVEPHLVSSALRCVVATRLIRRLCPDCKTVADLADYPWPFTKALDLAQTGGYRIPNGAVFFTSAGCDQCHGTGFRGRMGLYEVLPCTPALVSKMIRCTSEEDVTALAVEVGMKTLFADGMRKAVEGETSIDEVLRVTGTWL